VTWSQLADYVQENVEARVPEWLGQGARQVPNEVRNLAGRSPVLLSLAARETPVEIKATPKATVAQGTGLVPIHRLYHLDGIDHLYTTEDEVTGYKRDGYRVIGVEFEVSPEPGPGLVPLYRFSLPNGSHYLDTSRRSAMRVRGRAEIVLGYISVVNRPGQVALNGWYNPTVDRWFYTIDPKGEVGPQTGWRSVGVVGYVVPGR
jgi:hypothetical protein